ncbi:MAG: hypothetical protein IT323_20165, partial [Anaerolineae bacterium]|nr:hypothetical protein [Anaerolineae bacterium]
MMTQHRLPPFRVLILCALALGFLLLRGLDIGPLHPDVLIHRAWLAEVGAAGFTERYLAVNQRHLLVGPVNAAAYLVFLTDDLPYQVIFQLGRLLSGVFLAGIVARLGGGMALAVCSGLALSLTSLRVDHLYQGINWYIEPTLTMLLASAYLYIGSIQTPLPNRRRALYALSFALYAVSVLIYEAGLPWLALNGVLGVALRRSLPWPARLWRAVVEMAPFA